VLDVEHMATVRLIRNGGTVFDALTNSQSALRNLITSASATFATTAANNNQLAATLQVFPTFLNETKATFARLQAFANDTDPLVRELVPVADAVAPTLSAVRALSPSLQTLFVNLGPLVTASETGFPAFRDVLLGAKPLLGAVGPFLGELNPILDWLSLHQQLISDFISVGAVGVAAKTTAYGGSLRARR
jgi:phospholipid/cholesterol/gamma-HCH transport system substrate-binding protein